MRLTDKMDKAVDAGDEDRLWQAFLSRDRNLDGAVVCAVRSTRIYCRPTCPARRPDRSQVSFFRTPGEAKEAGFRACLRCLPDRPETDACLVAAACDFVDSYAETQGTLPTAAEVGEALGLSAGRLNGLFRREMGLTLSQFARGNRMKRFKALVRDGSRVSDAIYDAGFGSSSRLYENSSEELGMTPATYRKGGAGTTIHYIVRDSALGGLLVAGTASGVCAVKLGDDANPLIEELGHEFPAATLVQVHAGHPEQRQRSDKPGTGSGNLDGWAQALLEYLDGGRRDIDLPLDVVATAFQWRVWRQLQAIPPGETRTYQQLAEDLEHPRASRAVGRACATNPVAPIIPCHRALRKDGGLGGYRWGLHRKETLLEMERKQSEPGGQAPSETSPGKSG